MLPTPPTRSLPSRASSRPSSRVDIRVTLFPRPQAVAPAGVSGLAHYSRVMSAAREHERHLGVREEVYLVNRAPRSHVIPLGRYHEHRNPYIRERNGPVFYKIPPFGKVVVEKQACEILRVHTVRHPRRVRIPGHQVEHRLALPQEVVVHHTRPDEVVRPEHLKCPRHLLRVKIALVPHHILEKSKLALGDENHQLPPLVEVSLGGEKRYAPETSVTVPGHGS